MLPQQLTGLLLLPAQSVEPLKPEHQRFEPGPLAGDRLKPCRVGSHIGIRQLSLQSGEGATGGFQPFTQERGIHGSGDSGGMGYGAAGNKKPDAQEHPADGGRPVGC